MGLPVSVDLVLRLRFEIAGIVTFMQLARGIALKTVDHAPSLHGRTGVNPVSYTHLDVYKRQAGEHHQLIRHPK